MLASVFSIFLIIENCDCFSITVHLKQFIQFFIHHYILKIKHRFNSMNHLQQAQIPRRVFIDIIDNKIKTNQTQIQDSSKMNKSGNAYVFCFAKITMIINTQIDQILNVNRVGQCLYSIHERFSIWSHELHIARFY